MATSFAASDQELAETQLCPADEGSRESVDAKCKHLTASWVRERHVSNPEVEVCDFYETLEAAGADAVLEPGVYTLQVPAQDSGVATMQSDLMLLRYLNKSQWPHMQRSGCINMMRSALIGELLLI